MKIRIKTLEGDEQLFDLSEVGEVYEDDDVIYFQGVPCKLSSAAPVLPPVSAPDPNVCMCGHEKSEHDERVGCTHYQDETMFDDGKYCPCRRFEVYE